MSEIIKSNDVIKKLRHLKPELEKRYGVTRIGIFGSVVRNEARHGSDIDIVVDMAPDLLNRPSGLVRGYESGL